MRLYHFNTRRRVRIGGRQAEEGDLFGKRDLMHCRITLLNRLMAFPGHATFPAANDPVYRVKQWDEPIGNHIAMADG